MIPRRKITVDRNDFAQWLKSFRTASENNVPKFEDAFTQYLGCQYAQATASGRDALELILDAIDIKPDDEIIIPAYTLGELLPLIKATLIPADIEKNTFNIDPKDIQRKLSSKTRAILATHLFGAPCDIKTICQMAFEKNIFVIEDCAHAAGATVDSKKVGTFGHASIFSLEVNKAISTYGGGILVTNDKKIATSAARHISRRKQNSSNALRKAFITWMEEIVIRSPLYAPLSRILFSENISKQFEQFYRGTHNLVRTDTYAYTDFQARIGLKRLANLDQRNVQHNNHWNQLARSLSDQFIPQKRSCSGKPAFYNFVCLYKKDIRRLRKKLAHMGIDAGIFSEVMDDCAALLNRTDCPVAAYVYQHAVLLPLYESLSSKEFFYLMDVLTNIS
jgi:dTDP-4-amino-4,6-dideoxygalactose transaminase